MTDIIMRLQKHYDAAVAKYGEDAVFGVFLYGSWNYGTNLPDSDVDTKCILVPDLYHLAISPYEVKHLHVDDEVCECMTIMHMVENWKKQNINFLEIMFTPYFIINEQYEKFWERHRENEYEYRMSYGWAEQIARYDIKKAILSMANQAIHTITQDPSDLKKVMNAAHIANTLSALVTTPKTSYWSMIQANPTVAKIRTGETKVPSGMVEDLIIFFQEMIGRAREYEHLSSDKQKVDEYLNNFILSLIRHRIKI